MKSLSASVALSVLLCPAAMPSAAEGFILASSPVLRQLTETTQIAFIDVRSDHRVVVNVYIGVMDIPALTHPVNFAVPFFSSPQHLHVDVSNERRALQRAYEPDEALREYWIARQRIDRLPYWGIPAFSLLCTPAGLLFFLLPHVDRAPFPRSGLEYCHMLDLPMDVLSVRVVGDLGAFGKRGQFPEQVEKAITRYVGKHFAVVRIMPRDVEPPSPAARTPSRSPRMLHLRFTQRMRRTRGGWQYAYPLGTAAAWAAPINETVIYVSGGARSNLITRFPGEQKSSADPRLLPGDTAPSVARVAANRLQVHWARYPPHNRADDIVVTLRDSGKSALVSHPETARLAYVLMLTGMFVVAVMSWVAGFAIARWLRLWPDASFVHACGLAWLVGVAPATLTIVLLFVPVAIIETFNSLTAWRLPYADITESELLISALAFCTAGALAGWLLIFGRGRGRQTAAGLALLGLLAVVLLSHARKDSLAIEGVGMLIISLAILAAAIWCAARGVRAARQRVAPGPVYWGTVFWAVAASSVTYVLGVVGLTVLLDAVTPI